MKLLLLTQDHEWYGNDEGTQGRWKPKGGSEIEIGTFASLEASEIATIVDRFRPLCEINNKHCRSVVIDHIVLGDEELTEAEKLEVEYEGKVRYGRSYMHDGRVVGGAWYREKMATLAAAHRATDEFEIRNC